MTLYRIDQLKDFEDIKCGKFRMRRWIKNDWSHNTPILDPVYRNTPRNKGLFRICFFLSYNSFLTSGAMLFMSDPNRYVAHSCDSKLLEGYGNIEATDNEFSYGNAAIYHRSEILDETNEYWSKFGINFSDLNRLDMKQVIRNYQRR